MNTIPKTKAEARMRKRMAIYARVSTQEQTKGQYPSCTTQVEELEALCKAKDWEIFEVVRDEGYSAGSLKRPGLAHLRHLVESQQIDGIICTWYDRLVRTRDFYVLDHEFRANQVEFITLHDPTDRHTASGRFMETMLVAAKTYEREQTSEKVRTKMRQRAEKGLFNGGPVPFGFSRIADTQLIAPDAAKVDLVVQMFQVYVQSRSEFRVRDWLKAHGIPAPSGKPVWAPGTLCKLLTNRRYIGEVEINKNNKGLENVPESELYRVIKAPHDPIVPSELFELAQVIRQEKALESPNRRGRPRSYTQSRCGRVYPLQSIMVCGCCGSSMTPWYVHHKAGGRRKQDSTIYYYVCAQQIKGWKACDHKNIVLARVSESWIVERVEELVSTPGMVERVMAAARHNSESTLQPQQKAMARVKAALNENQAQIDQIIQTVASGKADGALLGFLNERAAELKSEREQLKAELRGLQETLQPLGQNFDAGLFRQVLMECNELVKEAQPEELQQILKLAVHRIIWMPDGRHRVQYYHLPKVREGNGHLNGRHDDGASSGVNGIVNGNGITSDSNSRGKNGVPLWLSTLRRNGSP